MKYRRGAGTRPAQRFFERCRICEGPQLAPGFGIVRGDGFLVLALLDGVGAPVAERERGVAAAHWFFPQALEPRSRPRSDNRALGVFAGAIGAAEIGPIRG